VAFNSDCRGDVRFYINDATGRTVAGSTMPVARGQQSAELPIGHLAKGWYSLRILLPDGKPLQSVGFVKE
jgi:hypothetical protein